MDAIPRPVRTRMLLRSFAVQGSWNYETLIGAGFAFTLLPALRFLYGGDGERLNQAVERHAALFNSHPYLATVAVGAVTRLEAEGAEPVVVERFKSALRSSLGSMGDRLIWSSWRPMSVLLGLVLILAGAAWWLAVAVFLIVYNSVHIGVRVIGLRMGSEAGLEVARVLREAPLQRVIDRASRVACFLVGMAVVLAVAPSVGEPATLGLVAVAILLGFTLGPGTRRAMIVILAGVAALALVLGFFTDGA